MISRKRLQQRLRDSLANFRITALLGPRQCGKTTLARSFDVPRGHYFDLEDPADAARLQNARDVLGTLEGLIIIDEFQRKPDLLPVLRVLADRPDRPARFLILGSASPSLAKGASESLAGRVHFISMSGLDCREVGVATRDRLWFRGGFPESYLAATDEVSRQWRRSFIQTFLRQDIPSLGLSIPAEKLHRFWMMAAHYHGQVWNSSAIAASLSISHPTARNYLDILAGAFVMRQLQPWLPNLKKRLVKSPKVYLRDSGLLHTLLQIEDLPSLQGNPRFGASWEGFALEQVCAVLEIEPEDAYFWATQAGAEIDLVVRRGGRLYGFEFKVSEQPTATRSMAIALSDLGLEKIYVVHPGEISFPLSEKIEALGYRQIPELQLSS
jgi:predicted AAA+ superfamily ATPase